LPLKDIKDFLNRDVTEVFGRRANLPQAPEQANCNEARLQIRNTPRGAEFWCTAPRVRLFTLNAVLAGILEVARSTSADRTPTVRVSIPLESNGRHTVQLLFAGEASESPWDLRRASVVTSPEHGRSLEFIFGDARDRALYRFFVPEALAVSDFEELKPEEPPTTTAPSVAQMAAVLRATLQQRRSTIAILADLAEPLSPPTRMMVAMMREKLSSRHVFGSQSLQWLQEHLRNKGRSFSPHLLAALCLLLDMEAGKIRPLDVEQMVLGRSTLEISWEAIDQVSRFEGETLDRKIFAEKFAGAGLPFPTRSDPTVFETMLAALAVIEDRMQTRDSRAVLANLLKESPSLRVERVVKQWKLRDQAAPLEAFRGFEAFHRYAAALGLRMDPATLLAFCLYPEIEAGRLAEDRFVPWLEGSGTLTLSAYTRQVVCAALDHDVLALAMPGQRFAKPLISGLQGLSPGGFMQGLCNDDGETMFRFGDPQDPPPKGWRPNGEVLLRAPILDQISERDLRLFLRLGYTLYACFQSDLDRRLVWRQLRPEDQLEEGATFLDGFRVFHFQSRTVAELGPGSHPGSPAMVRDNRGSLHFFRAGEPAPDGEPVDRMLVGPPSVGLPEMLPELETERLLGKVDAAASDTRRLELLNEALQQVLEKKTELGPALTDRGLRAIGANLESPRVMQTLRPVVDNRTLEYLRTVFLNPERPALDYRIYEPILQGLRHQEVLDFTCMALIYELCVSELTSAKTIHKSFDRLWFRSALRNQILQVLESENPAVRQLGCKLLSTSSCIGDANERVIVEYELMKHLDAENRGVALEAAGSLVQLALEEYRPLAPLWQFAPPAPPEPSRAPASADRPPVVMQVAHEIRDWLYKVNGLLSDQPKMPGTTTLTIKTTPAQMEMARLIAGARLALEADATAAAFTYFLASDAVLKEMLKRFMAAWQDYCDERLHLSGRELIQAILREGATEAFLAHAATVPALGWTDLARGLPTWAFADISSPTPLWVTQPGVEGRAPTSALFLQMLGMVMEQGADHVRLCRLRAVEGLAALNVQMFNIQSGAFMPFLEDMRIPSQFFLSLKEQEVLNALGEVLLGTGRAETRRLDEETASAAIAAGGEPPLDTPQSRKVAGHLLQVFQMPESYLQQVLYILRDAHAQTGTRLW